MNDVKTSHFISIFGGMSGFEPPEAQEKKTVNPGKVFFVFLDFTIFLLYGHIPGNKGAVATASGAGSSEIVITNPNNSVSAASDQNIESRRIADSVTDESKDSISSDSTVLQVFDSDISAGNYIAGKDIPAGNYDFTLVSGTGNVMTDNYSTGNVNVIFGADSPAYVTELKEVNKSK